MLAIRDGTRMCDVSYLKEIMTNPTNSDVFRFLSLPGELRHEIYRLYLGCWDAVIEYDRKSARFVIGGQPEYNLMLANRTTHVEGSCLIPQTFSGRLILRDTKVRRERGFGFVSSFDAIESLCPEWLLEKTTLLSIVQGSTGMLASLPWSRLKCLQEIHLESNSLPVCYYYPNGVALGARGTEMKHASEGRNDTWCLNGYNSWSHIPEAVAAGHVRVLTLRSGIIKGASLEIWVEHRSECAEVVRKTITPIL